MLDEERREAERDGDLEKLQRIRDSLGFDNYDTEYLLAYCVINEYFIDGQLGRGEAIYRLEKLNERYKGKIHSSCLKETLTSVDAFDNGSAENRIWSSSNC
jgi:hypothetical protein